MPGTNELKCDDLTLCRGPDRFAFTLSLQPGELLVVIGPSGAGKSTLLDLLAGFALPDSGRLTLAGADLLALPPAERPFITLFQSHNLFEHLSVAQNIGLGVNPNLKLSPSQQQYVVQAASRLGLAGLLERRPPELSESPWPVVWCGPAPFYCWMNPSRPWIRPCDRRCCRRCKGWLMRREKGCCSSPTIRRRLAR